MADVANFITFPPFYHIEKLLFVAGTVRHSESEKGCTYQTYSPSFIFFPHLDVPDAPDILGAVDVLVLPDDVLHHPGFWQAPVSQ